MKRYHEDKPGTIVGIAKLRYKKRKFTPRFPIVQGTPELPPHTSAPLFPYTPSPVSTVQSTSVPIEQNTVTLIPELPGNNVIPVTNTPAGPPSKPPKNYIQIPIHETTPAIPVHETTPVNPIVNDPIIPVNPIVNEAITETNDPIINVQPISEGPPAVAVGIENTPITSEIVEPDSQLVTADGVSGHETNPVTDITITMNGDLLNQSLNDSVPITNEPLTEENFNQFMTGLVNVLLPKLAEFFKVFIPQTQWQGGTYIVLGGAALVALLPGNYAKKREIISLWYEYGMDFFLSPVAKGIALFRTKTQNLLSGFPLGEYVKRMYRAFQPQVNVPIGLDAAIALAEPNVPVGDVAPMEHGIPDIPLQYVIVNGVRYIIGKSITGGAALISVLKFGQTIWKWMMDPSYTVSVIFKNEIAMYEYVAEQVNTLGGMTQTYVNWVQNSWDVPAIARMDESIAAQEQFIVEATLENFKKLVQQQGALNQSLANIMEDVKRDKHLDNLSKGKLFLLLQEWPDLRTLVPKNPLSMGLRINPYNSVYMDLNGKLNNHYYLLEQNIRQLLQQGETTLAERLRTIREQQFVIIQELQKASALKEDYTQITVDSFHDAVKQDQQNSRSVLKVVVDKFTQQLGRLQKPVTEFFEYLAPLLVKSFIKYLVQFFVWSTMSYVLSSGMLLSALEPSFLNIMMDQVMTNVLGEAGGLLSWLKRTKDFVRLYTTDTKHRPVSDLYQYPVTTKNPYDAMEYGLNVLIQYQQTASTEYQKTFASLTQIPMGERNGFIQNCILAGANPFEAVKNNADITKKVAFDYHNFLENRDTFVYTESLKMMGANAYLSGIDPVSNPMVFPSKEEFLAKNRADANIRRGTIPTEGQGFPLDADKINQLKRYTPSHNALGETPKGPIPNNAKPSSSVEEPALPQPSVGPASEGLLGKLFRFIKEGIVGLWKKKWKLLKGYGVWAFMTAIQLGVSIITDYVYENLRTIAGPYFEGLKEYCKEWYFENTEDLSIGNIAITPEQLANSYNQYLPENLEVHSSQSMLFEVDKETTVNYEQGFHYLCYGSFLQACIQKGRQLFLEKIVPAEINRYSMPGYWSVEYTHETPHVPLVPHETNALVAYISQFENDVNIENYIQEHMLELLKDNPRKGQLKYLMHSSQYFKMNDYVHLAMQLIIDNLKENNAYNQQVYQALQQQAEQMVSQIDTIFTKVNEDPLLSEKDLDAVLSAQALYSATDVMEGICQLVDQVEYVKEQTQLEKEEMIVKGYAIGAIKCSPFIIGLIARAMRLRG